MAADPKPPTNEKGQPAFSYGVPGFDTSWNHFIDDREYVPDLQWPLSIGRYQSMQSDAQLKGLLLAATMPVRRFLWAVNPNEARPEVVGHIARSYNLPVKNQEAPTLTRGFNHDRHMAYSFQAFGYGHYYFEEVFEYRSARQGGDGRLHLVKLGTRPPRTITNFLVERDGELRGIEQQGGGIGASGGGGVGIPGAGTELSRNRLLAYVWNPQDDADWVGQSMLRACYRNWLIKDRLLRVDATKHERNAMGVPWFETLPGATQKQIDDLARIAEEVRASTKGGGAGPGRLRIAAPEGTLPDTIQSVRYHDEQMAKNFLMLFFNLGGDATSGSRALGESFIEWYTENQGALADWYVEATQETINREVAYNWGPDEACPTLTYTRVESADLAFADLVSAVDKGLIAVDEEIESYIRQRWRIPANTPEPAPALPPPPPTPPAPPAPPAAAEPPRRPEDTPRRSAMAARIEATVKSPMRWADVARAVGSDPKNGTARRAREELVAAGAIVKRLDSQGATVLAPLLAIKLPDRELHREPFPFEVAASVDFAAIERTFLDDRESLVEAVQSMQGAQIDELSAAVAAADGDAAKLAALRAEPVDADVIAEHLRETARAGEASAQAERDAQLGASASTPVAAATADTVTVDRIVHERADAAALTLAGGLSAAASKRAAAVSTLPAADAALEVGNYLRGLSAAALEEQLGGATTQALNTGRREFMRVNKAQTVYASEILDERTCAQCNAIDGTEWPNVAASESDYPIGGYAYCEGGLRCRGTIVAVY